MPAAYAAYFLSLCVMQAISYACIRRYACGIRVEQLSENDTKIKIIGFSLEIMVF
jgi:hypothetical protein